MDQQLKQALELHQQNQLDQALQTYQVILERASPPLQAFLNSSSFKFDLSSKADTATPSGQETFTLADGLAFAKASVTIF